MAVLTRRQILATVLGALVVSACLAPTLPLPPPSQPDVSGPDEQGNIRLTGNAPESNVLVFALNGRTGQIVGALTEADARYDLVMAAVVGDEITFWYKVGIDDSPSIRFRVRPPP